MSILKLAENFFDGDSQEIPPEAYCKHRDFPSECRYCAANELGERIRKEWPSIPWKGLTGAMIREANLETHCKGPDGQNVMF